MTSFEVEFLLVEVNTGRPVGVRVLAAGGHCGLMRCMTCVWCLPLQSASTSPMFLHSEFPIENRTNYGEPQSAGSCSAPRPCACEPPTPPAHRPPLVVLLWRPAQNCSGSSCSRTGLSPTTSDCPISMLSCTWASCLTWRFVLLWPKTAASALPTHH